MKRLALRLVEAVAGALNGWLCFLTVQYAFDHAWIESAGFTPDQQHLLAKLMGFAVFVAYRLHRDDD